MLIEAGASAGEAGRAIAYARQAVEERDPLFVLLARLWPGYEQLRGDARFEEIVAQLSLPG